MNMIDYIYLIYLKKVDDKASIRLMGFGIFRLLVQSS